MAYVPDRGHIVWLTFNPQVGHEQAGRRPALILSPALYNGKAGLALFCPITNQIKRYPYELAIPDGLDVKGVVLCDQVRSLDWQARDVQFITQMPDAVVKEVIKKLDTLLK